MNVRAFFSRQTVVALFCCPILLCSLNSAGLLNQFSKQKLLSDSGYELTPAFFKFVSGGFWPAAVDGLWIETLQLVGSVSSPATVLPETLPAARNFYRLATDLDPWFYELYEQAGVLFLFYFDHAEAGSEILKKGIAVFESKTAPGKFWTHPETLYIFLAYIYAFQLNDWKQAKEIYLKAGELKSAPAYLKQMRSWLLTKGSEKELARRTLTLLIRNTDDPVIKQKYQEKLRRYE